MMEVVWSVLLFICIGLACAHIVSAIRTQPSQGENVIERTFTANTNAVSRSAR
jgi:hypothetical protein